MSDLEKKLARAEADFPVGRTVRYYPIASSSEHVDTKIRSKPWALGHGAIVIAIEARSGGVAINHLEVI